RMSTPHSVCNCQPAQLHAQNRPLNAIHTGIPADHRVEILLGLAMVTEHLNLGAQFSIVRGNCTCFSESAKVFSRIETKTAGYPQPTSFATLVWRTMRLTGIFHQRQSMATGDLDDRIHVGHLTIKVYWNDCAGAG